MKQLLLATATLVGMGSAALAAEPVALSDSQLDNVTAGQGAFLAFGPLPAVPSLYPLAILLGAPPSPGVLPLTAPVAVPGLPSIPGI